MNRKALFEVFGRIDDALQSPQTLCVIGASAILGYGHPTRQTDDIDVWRPASQVNDRQMARAAGVAGVAIDHGEELPEGIYLQFIEPGIVQLPGYQDGKWATGESNVRLWTGDHLTVEAPPPSIVAAAKLVRAEERDIDDCVYLIRAKGLSEPAIRRAIARMSDPMARETAGGNLVILEVVAARTTPRREIKRDENDGGLTP